MGKSAWQWQGLTIGESGGSDGDALLFGDGGPVGGKGSNITEDLNIRERRPDGVGQSRVSLCCSRLAVRLCHFSFLLRWLHTTRIKREEVLFHAFLYQIW